MKVTDLLDSRRAMERVGEVQDVRHPPDNLQRRRPRIVRKPVGELREPEAVEDFDRFLTTGE
jgi:hypothetical protein